MENFKAVIERRSPFSIKLLGRRYVVIHLERIKSLLNREDAITSCLDMGTYRQYVDELEHNWDDNIYMGCCVVRKEDQAEKPIAVAIASASAYRTDVRRPTELNWRRTDANRQKQQQWCLDYLVRRRVFRGSGVGCFALVGLMECFCSRFGYAILWLLLASATETCSLCTQMLGFLSCRFTLTRIASCRYKSRTSDRECAESCTETQPKGCKTVPGCSTDNDFARSFSKWLRNSCSGGKSLKQSDISVSRALKFIKFCCDENGDGEEDVLNSPNLFDYALGSPQLLTKFVDSLKEKWGLGQSAQISYVASISDLLDFRKFNRPSASVLQNFAVTEVYVKRARKCLAKDMKSNWTTELDIETLESRRSWATLSEVQSVIPFHKERYKSVLENCIVSPSVKTGDVTFATRFVAACMFLKVKGCRPMTYQHLTLRMFESAKRNEGMVDQKIFKTAKRYSFDSVYFDECSIELLEKYIMYIQPVLTPTCEFHNFRNLQIFSVCWCSKLSENTFTQLNTECHTTLRKKLHPASFIVSRSWILEVSLLSKVIGLTLRKKPSNLVLYYL
ncbi:partial [Paramuricea clavata]|uniref:Partial n=1 Tax=Paramuricea clavata TaxID=317549 RepID=A0A7D9E5V9_PARCT|nr:partial [Paramuricea clavata]